MVTSAIMYFYCIYIFVLGINAVLKVNTVLCALLFQTCPPSELQLPLRLRWERCSDMVYGMTDYPYSVMLHRKIYIGGGSAGNDSENRTIQVYDMDNDVWSILPRYEYMWFAMTVVNSHLTLIGGKNISTRRTTEVTNQLAAFDPTSKNWTYPYPPMPTRRYVPAVSTYDIWLLVAGGINIGDLTEVELLNTSTNQWLSASPLPTPCGDMISTILQDDWYLVTSRKQVVCVSLPDIVSRIVSPEPTTDRSYYAIWRHLPNTPLENSAAIALCGSLVAVGGSYGSTRSTAIHLYQPERKKWTKVGDLPTERRHCFCTVLPNGKLLVAGGSENSGRYTRRVDMAAVLD